jgi:hypothetical protein
VDNKLKAVEDLLTERLKTACPNPSRLGCPSQEFLTNLAKHEVPIEKTAAWIDHLESCSECFLDFSRFSEAISRRKRRMQLIALGSVAAAFLCVVLMGEYVAHHGFRLPGKSATLATQTPINGAAQRPSTVAVLHLEDLSVVRGENEQSRPDKIPNLERGLLKLSIYLPPDSDPGVYTLQILSKLADKKSLLTFSGRAEAKDGHEILRASADLTLVPPGSYYLALRHERGVWRYYRITLS